MALRWLLQRSCVTSVVIGVKTLEQLSDNLGATTWALSEADSAQLDALSAVPVPCECAQCSKMRLLALLEFRPHHALAPELALCTVCFLVISCRSLVAPANADPWEMVSRCQGGRTRE